MTNWLLRYGHLNIGCDALFWSKVPNLGGLYLKNCWSDLSKNWNMIVFSHNNPKYLSAKKEGEVTFFWVI